MELFQAELFKRLSGQAADSECEHDDQDSEGSEGSEAWPQIEDEFEEEEEEGDEEREKLDYSGRPGYTCSICSRGSESVGPRRGFNYKDEYCGGC